MALTADAFSTSVDWRKDARRRAGVKSCIAGGLDALPEAYSDEAYEAACERVYQHILESYASDGRSKHQAG